MNEENRVETSLTLLDGNASVQGVNQVFGADCTCDCWVDSCLECTCDQCKDVWTDGTGNTGDGTCDECVCNECNGTDCTCDEDSDISWEDNAGDSGGGCTCEDGWSSEGYGDDAPSCGSCEDCGGSGNNSVPLTLTVSPSRLTMRAMAKAELSAQVPAVYAGTPIEWISYQPGIAKVSRDGVVTAGERKGTATIRASAKDQKAFCTITVDPRPLVWIEKDDIKDDVTGKVIKEGFRVTFEGKEIGAGRTWKSVLYDLNVDPTSNPSYIADRYRYNDQQIFDDDQLAFLYLFDPLGVEYYLRKYNQNYDRHIPYKELPVKKDRVYQKIFGERPRLFQVDQDGMVTYYEYPDHMTYDERWKYYSDAEVLFGEHTYISLGKLIRALANLLLSLFKSLPVVGDGIELGISVMQALFFSGAITGLVSGKPTEFLTMFIDKQNKLNPPGITLTFVMGNVFNALDETLDMLMLPDLTDMKIYKKVDTNVNYNVIYKTKDGNIFLQDIIGKCE